MGFFGRGPRLVHCAPAPHSVSAAAKNEAALYNSFCHISAQGSPILKLQYTELPSYPGKGREKIREDRTKNDCYFAKTVKRCRFIFGHRWHTASLSSAYYRAGQHSIFSDLLSERTGPTAVGAGNQRSDAAKASAHVRCRVIEGASSKSRPAR